MSPYNYTQRSGRVSQFEQKIVVAEEIEEKEKDEQNVLKKDRNLLERSNYLRIEWLDVKGANKTCNEIPFLQALM